MEGVYKDDVADFLHLEIKTSLYQLKCSHLSHKEQQQRRPTSSSPASLKLPTRMPVVAPPRRNSKLRRFKNKLHLNTS